MRKRVLAQTLAHIWRASKHEEEVVLRMLFAQNERIPNGWSGLGAYKRDSTRSLFHKNYKTGKEKR